MQSWVRRGLPVVVVNQRQVRDFARASGQLAKTAAASPWAVSLLEDRVILVLERNGANEPNISSRASRMLLFTFAKTVGLPQ